MENRKTSVEKMQNSFSHQIEQAPWKKAKKRIRKMVIEIGSVFESMYTRYRATARKEHLNGKLPLKHELKTVLFHALDEVPKRLS